MDKDSHDFSHIIKQIQDADTNDFCELAFLIGRDPKTDFAGSDLSNTDLSGSDLSRADLTNISFRNCNLSNADLRYSDLSG